MDKIKATEIISLAKKEGEKIADLIKLKSLNKKGTSKLSYLFGELHSIQSSITSSIPCFNYDLKHELYTNYSDNNLFQYLQTKRFDKAILDFKRYWKDYKDESLLLEGEHTVQDFLLINIKLIPAELRYIIEQEGTEKLEDVDEIPIVVSILAQFEASKNLESMIKDEFLFSAEVLQDKFDDLQKKFNGRISWLGTYQEFAFLFQELIDKYWIGIESTSAMQKAILFKSHFHIPAGKGEVASVSLKDAFTKGYSHPNTEELFLIKENQKKKKHH